MEADHFELSLYLLARFRCLSGECKIPSCACMCVGCVYVCRVCVCVGCVVRALGRVYVL